jgi:hypothetical protein
MEEAALEFFVFVVGCLLSWYLGGFAVWKIWLAIAKYNKSPWVEASPLAPVLGGLERCLYVFSVLADKYEVIAGWLVMKAFFGWIQFRHHRTRSHEERAKEGHDVLGRYNGFLILNLLSLFVGLSFGVAAHFVVLLFFPQSKA